ncbi:Brix domain-containing protein [Entamoeba marina]
MPRIKKQTYRQIRQERKEKKREKSVKLQNEEIEYKRIPKSFVIHRGRVGKIGKELVKDSRYFMLPHTATHLQERSSNTINELKMAGMEMYVSHFLIYTSAASGLHLRIGKLPRGPTCLFKVVEYSLRKDIQKASGVMYPNTSVELRHPPLLILSGFNKGGEQLKTARMVLQQMFPPIQASVVKLDTYKRALLFSYDAETDTIHMRHYAIRTRKPTRDDIGKETDETFEEEKVVLPVDFNGNENVQKKKSFVRLIDIGPRLSLKLLSIYSDFLKGKVLYRLYDYQDDTEWLKENASFSSKIDDSDDEMEEDDSNEEDNQMEEGDDNEEDEDDDNQMEESSSNEEMEEEGDDDSEEDEDNESSSNEEMEED